MSSILISLLAIFSALALGYAQEGSGRKGGGRGGGGGGDGLGGRTKCNLAQLGEEFSVDKMNPYHNFQSLYCDLFRPIRQMKLKMLEIGFGCGHHVHGQSAKMWKAFFPKLSYYAVDYTDENVDQRVRGCFENFSKENPGMVEKIWFGDQANKVFLSKIVNEYNSTFDIIIDDGGHTYEQQKESFIALWPLVSNGGYYIVEDLALQPGFSHLVSDWIKLIGHGVDTGKHGGPYDKSIPQYAKIIGCAFQICYVKKFLPPAEQLPIIWGKD